MPRYLVEFVGTFFLVLIIALAVHAAGSLAPLAIGVGLAALVYLGGPISGAHYNPAVTLAFLLRGTLKAGDVAPYVGAQLLGAILAAFAAAHITGVWFAPAPGLDVVPGAPLLAEILFTFLLAAVILQVASDPAVAGNPYYGVAIGFTVMAGAFAVGGVSGGVFNPAVGVGPILVDLAFGGGSPSALWLYLVGPFVGAALAVGFYRATHPERGSES